VERSAYWRDVATKLNQENIELKLRAMDVENAFRFHAVWIAVGVALLLVAIMMRCG
jgi:hypothetical protein